MYGDYEPFHEVGVQFSVSGTGLGAINLVQRSQFKGHDEQQVTSLKKAPGQDMLSVTSHILDWNQWQRTAAGPI